MADKSCPIPTQSIKENLANRQKALDVANYGPANPEVPGKYWREKAARMHTTEVIASTMLCGNCAFFNVSPRLLDCIANGIGQDASDVISAGQLGYCEAFDFKCAAKRTCDAWVTGGPIETDKEETLGSQYKKRFRKSA